MYDIFPKGKKKLEQLASLVFFLSFSSPAPSVIRKEFTLYLSGWFPHSEKAGQRTAVTSGCPTARGGEVGEGSKWSALRWLRRELSWETSDGSCDVMRQASTPVLHLLPTQLAENTIKVLPLLVKASSVTWRWGSTWGGSWHRILWDFFFLFFNPKVYGFQSVNQERRGPKLIIICYQILTFSSIWEGPDERL